MKELIFENSKTELKIAGNDFSVEMESIDVIEAYEQFRTDVIAIGKKLQDGGNTVSNVKEYCELAINAAEKLLGEGAAKKIFGDTINFGKCNQFVIYMLNVYTEFWQGFEAEIKTQQNNIPEPPKHTSYGYRNKRKH